MYEQTIGMVSRLAACMPVCMYHAEAPCMYRYALLQIPNAINIKEKHRLRIQVQVPCSAKLVAPW